MTAKELYERYQADLAELQKHCTHPATSDWMEEQWAPGHGTGRDVRTCSICNQVIDSRGTTYKDNHIEVTFH